MADPLDKQLVEAVLTRPRRARADVEEARLATRNLRAAKVLLPAEKEVVLAKAIELGEQLVEEPWKGIVSLHEWTLHDTEHKTRTQKPQHRLPLGEEAHTLVRSALTAPGAADLLVAPPDFHLIKAGRDVQSDGTKDLLREAKKLVATYSDAPTPENFLTLLDWSSRSRRSTSAAGCRSWISSRRATSA